MSLRLIFFYHHVPPLFNTRPTYRLPTILFFLFPFFVDFYSRHGMTWMCLFFVFFEHESERNCAMRIVATLQFIYLVYYYRFFLSLLSLHQLPAFSITHTLLSSTLGLPLESSWTMGKGVSRFMYICKLCTVFSRRFLYPKQRTIPNSDIPFGIANVMDSLHAPFRDVSFSLVLVSLPLYSGFYLGSVLYVEIHAKNL